MRLMLLVFTGLMSLPTLAEPDAAGGCPSEEAVARHVDALRQGRPGSGFGLQLSPGQVGCARAALVEALPAVLGQRVGYKAAFTGKAVQQRFGVPGPAWGVMFDRYLLTSGASLPAAFGAVPRFEPDLLVEVAGPGLAQAATPAEALRHLRAVIPFIELPDLILDGPANGHAIAAINTGFRGGVLGDPISVEENVEALQSSLASMTVSARDAATGTRLGEARGGSLMEHPLNAAIWLARALLEAGIPLRPGDLLSLGGFMPPAAPAPGMQLEVRYQGLPGNPVVVVHFTREREAPASGPES